MAWTSWIFQSMFVHLGRSSLASALTGHHCLKVLAAADFDGGLMQAQRPLKCRKQQKSACRAFRARAQSGAATQSGEHVALHLEP